MNIAGILSILRLPQYEDNFVKHEIDDDLLFDLTSEDLLEIGITPLGHRKRILTAIDEIRKADADDKTEIDGGQRRQVSILFADLVGSTQMSQTLDTEALRELTRTYQAIAKDAIEKYGGHIAQYLGDGVLAYFGYPISHEDDAERAIRAGLDLQEGLADIRNQFLERMGVDVAARIAIETGPVIVGGRVGEDSAAIGETPNLAARLQSDAEPGTVVVGPGTHSLINSNVQTKSLGKRHLKGFQADIEMWRVEGIGYGLDRITENQSQERGKFVGRADELVGVEKALGQVKAGASTTFHIVGEPGIGKSRLVHEFRNRRTSATRFLAGNCPPLGASALHPFASILTTLSNAGGRVSDVERIERFSKEVVGLDGSLEQDLPFLLRLANLHKDPAELDPDTIATRTHKALLKLLCAYGQLLPTVLFINDTHWIDERSEAVLNELVRLEPKGLLILTTYRPEYTPPWTKYKTVKTIELRPLDTEASVLLYREYGGKDETLAEDIAERSGGNPLFIEELAEIGKIEVLEGRMEHEFPVPSNLSGLLMQRVDHLSEKSREFIQAASVAGRRFSIDLILPQGVQRDLAVAELAKSRLLINESEAGYMRFKHALMQDAIYGSLLKADKCTLHARIAQRLEDKFHERESEVAEELARHYEIAGNSLAAARYAYTAGEKALELFALRDSSRWFDKCLKLFPEELERQDEQIRASVVISQMQVLCWEARFNQMVELGDRELNRMRALNNATETSRILSWLGEAYLHDWRYDEARVALDEALRIAEEVGDDVCIGHALVETAWLKSIVAKGAEVAELDEILSRLFEIGERRSDRFIVTQGHYSKWAQLCHAGLLSEARSRAEVLHGFGETTGYPPALCWGSCMMAYVEALTGNRDSALEHCQMASSTAECAFDRLAADLCQALVYQVCGQPKKADEKFTSIGRSVRNVGSFFFGYASNIARGKVLCELGKTDEGIKLLTQLADEYYESGNTRAAAMAMTALGQIHANVGNNAEAITWLDRAIELSEECQSEGLIAEALVEKAKLARLANKQEEADILFGRAKKISSNLGWLALQQRVNQAAGG
jgi:class 3 adenylate cyclase/tetratricopeptide (TPR) repeat protein